ncbi:MAG: DNA-deoxyinosine glycosylase [Zetaproteobacteria bacterium CG12_big_fil_rev_8_21_14_0_65_54_13]|nr:MAG: DNA-deoxyinosine glycosylase [Zetaproteobacteria bacterium CG23_combo_of_CG06-09_8_20_14_all_54_7]PIW49836.1 MAG: DNA-deoxyinosine glycosylase [Zetaproteobacteria bacterium CG12_big_fil_rev_8_21_14_0_65_54_13]PIX54405.1 MAG: DNA-deoxyinosine glycosylase [Zetaproteobacteria bacterium CG_4_10_14_3_um_filter_54_28]PJA31156.1 MAG: DNA-deoxyinosine glycosylase [Zetaproteobacteria bacterium CG_4_9_14_3_um_filter_54_145]
MIEQGFPYSAGPDATTLILGSMPGRKSLDEQQYYAHPRNAFWPIMGELLGFSAELAYEERLALLRSNGIALWDVAHQCIRPGSLDSAIKLQSVVTNDFETFFDSHPQIRAVCFNGRKAADLYQRRVVHKLARAYANLPQYCLPSTSPAHAAISFDNKLAQWQQISMATLAGLQAQRGKGP